MSLPRPGPLVGAALLALTALGVAGCASGTVEPTATPADVATSSSAAGSAGTPGSSAGTATGATEVDVSGTEFAFSLSQQEFTPGDYTFVLSDDGSAPHALTITGPGVDATSDRVGPGETAELTVTLQAGDYELLCPVGSHADQGMRMTITVG